MKITIEIEVDDDFQPCTYGCTMSCPFGYVDNDDWCVNLHRGSDGYEWTCQVKEAMKKENKDE